MTIEELEQKVQMLEDIEAIKQMHNEYIFCLINREYERMVDFYAEDAELDVVTYTIEKGKPKRTFEKGTKEIKKFLTETIKNYNLETEGETPKGGHFLVQPVIAVEGDKATGHWMLERMVEEGMTEAGSRWALRQARYDCEYIKEDGHWKFWRVSLTHPWPGKAAQ